MKLANNKMLAFYLNQIEEIKILNEGMNGNYYVF